MDILNKTNDRQKKISSKSNCGSCGIPFNQCKHHLRNSRTFRDLKTTVRLKPNYDAIHGDGNNPKKILSNLQFNCRFCGISFHEKSKFIEHNSEAGHQICSECKQHLKNQTDLKNHVDEIHSWFKCQICSKSFSSKSKWEGKLSNFRFRLSNLNISHRARNFK